MKTYVINLDRDIEKLNTISKNLYDVGISPLRFKAIDGSTVHECDSFISEKNFQWMPKSVVGIAMSHCYLLDYIYKNDDNDYALILEDDVLPVFTDKEDILNNIVNIPPDWDAILLYCQGICNYTRKPLINYYGSNAAYIVNISSIPKILKNKIYTHVDMQWWNHSNLKVYKTDTPLFIPDFSMSSSNTITSPLILKKICNFLFDGLFERDITHASSSTSILDYKIIRIGGKEYTPYHILLCIIIILLLIVIYIKYFK